MGSIDLAYSDWCVNTLFNAKAANLNDGCPIETELWQESL